MMMDLFGDLPAPDQNQHNDVKVTSLPEENNRSQLTGSKRKSTEDGQVICAKEQKMLEEKDHHLPSSIYRLKGFVADRQGEREEMQDAHILMNDLLSQIPDVHPSIQRLSLYCVFDGHGGSRASRFASQHLPTNLLNRFPKGNLAQVEKEIKKVLIESFKKTDEDFLKEAKIKKPTWKDGSTAVVVLAINNTLYIANLGDSKAVLCRYKETEGKCVGVPLTSDHSPSTYDERIRIQKAGGWVKDGRVLGQLEVSRSIGDGPYKKHGVISTPDIKRCTLTNNDRYIMIACDGLWKSYSIEESIEFIETVLKDDSTETLSKKSNKDTRCNVACGKLASSAVLKLSGDNVTVLLVTLSKE